MSPARSASPRFEAEPHRSLRRTNRPLRRGLGALLLVTLGPLASVSCCSCFGELVGISPSAPEAPWRYLFDGESLGDWSPSEYLNAGEPHVEGGRLILPFGEFVTGVTLPSGLPAKSGYEIALDAMRVEGADFFCGLTFPCGEAHASLIIGGWGGDVCGISSLDGKDAGKPENPTHTTRSFERERWYSIRLQVLASADGTPRRIAAWIDEEPLLDVSLEGRQVGIRRGVEPSVPLGLASYQTTAALRNIRWREIAPVAEGDGSLAGR